MTVRSRRCCSNGFRAIKGRGVNCHTAGLRLDHPDTAIAVQATVLIHEIPMVPQWLSWHCSILQHSAPVEDSPGLLGPTE